MSGILKEELQKYMDGVTPEMVQESRDKFDSYMGRTYGGKQWRRLSNEEVISLGDAELLAQLEALNKASDPVYQASEAKRIEDLKEITSDQQFVVGVGGDIGGADGRAYTTDEDFAKLDVEIETERKRLYRLITAPPRTDRYIEIFKKKFPNKTEDEIRAGFVLSKDGVHTPDYEAWMERQNNSHTRSGASRLTKEEVARREEIAPENKKAESYASLEATMAIHRQVLGNSLGASADLIAKQFKDDQRKAMIEKSKFEVMEDDHFIPEEDLRHPVTFVDMPVDELLQQQRDGLKITEIVRGIPEVKNGQH